jgi:large subunit ribosomal protein L34e
MPTGQFRSRTLRRVFVKAPGGNVKIQYKERKPKRSPCGVCGTQLAGVPRERVPKMMAMPKSSKRPERPYGGVLCSSCMRTAMQRKARGAQ